MKHLAIESALENVGVVFRPRTDCFFIAFVWVVIASINLLLNYSHGAIELIRFSVVALVMLAIFMSLFSFFYVEVLNFTPDVLTYRTGPFGISRATTYQLRAVQDLRFAPPKWDWLRTPSGLAFDCYGKDERICRTIKQEEAKEIVAAVLQQFPRLKFVPGGPTEGEPEPEPPPPFIDGP